MESYTPLLELKENPPPVGYFLPNQSTVNHEMRKANRAQCRKDRDEFEELAYSIQDEIISKVATAKED